MRGLYGYLYDVYKLSAAAVRTNTGLKAKREAVEQGLRTPLRLKQQIELRKLSGTYEWEGDLDAMRREVEWLDDHLGDELFHV